MTENVTVKRRIRIDGQDYESLDEAPADKREAFAKAIASIPSSVAGEFAATISVNGHTWSKTAKIPPALRGLVEGALSAAASAPAVAEPAGEAIRPEPLISERVMVVMVGVGLLLIAALVWLMY